MTHLHIITSTSTGGAERQLAQLAQSYSTDDIIVLSLKPMGEIGLNLQGLGVKVYSGSSSNALNLSWIWLLVKILKSNKISAVHGWMYHANFACMFTRTIGYKGPIYWNVRHSIKSLSRETFAIRVLVKLLAILSPYASQIIFNSKVSLDQHARIGFRCKTHTYIPNGIDTSKFTTENSGPFSDEFRSSIGISKTTILIGLVSRYHPMKNIELFLSCFNRICNMNPQLDIHCVVIGTDIPSRLGNFLKEESIANVSLLHSNKNIHMIFPIFNIFVSASSWGEGFSNVIGEAMSCGVPVIATNVGDSPLIVGDCGFVCEPSIESMSNVLKVAIQTPKEMMIELGLRARSRIVDNFSLNSYIKAYKSYASV